MSIKTHLNRCRFPAAYGCCCAPLFITSDQVCNLPSKHFRDTPYTEFVRSNTSIYAVNKITEDRYFDVENIQRTNHSISYIS